MDPCETDFIKLLDEHIRDHPCELVALDESLVSRLESLLAGVVVDLDEALPDDVSI